jgi:hypothetical protein
VIDDSVANDIRLIRLNLSEHHFRNFNAKSSENRPVVEDVLLMRSGIIVVEIGVNWLSVSIHDGAEDEVEWSIIAEGDGHCDTVAVDSPKYVLRHYCSLCAEFKLTP